ncbi:class I SAM-dependent methyltransferase [Candidatus Dependentiae bacterium]|nr:class I SAM-dependent methyltransferase [Candidatus Dependentiae bacterium]
MFKKIFILLFFVSIILGNQLSKEEKDIILRSLSKEKYFLYQDIIINGQIVWQGVGPNCSQRYECIKKILDQYNRPIKVLDLGASNGYFSFRIAQDYQALCVMMDTSDRLLDICFLNNRLKGIVYLKQLITLQALSLLAEYEHFDIVLAFNILHHVSSCKQITDLLFKLGDIVIIETPPANDPRVHIKNNIPFLEQYLLAKMNLSGGKILGSILRPMPQQFDHISCMSVDLDLFNQIQYCENVYSKIFCFGTINNQMYSNLFFNKDIYNALGGVYYQ